MLLKSLPNVKPLLTGQLILKILSKKKKLKEYKIKIYLEMVLFQKEKEKEKGKIAAAIDYVAYLANN